MIFKYKMIFLILKNKGYDHNQVSHLQYKFQDHKVLPSKLLVENNSITLNVTQNRTNISCNHPLGQFKCKGNATFIKAIMNLDKQQPHFLNQLCKKVHQLKYECL